ncbi:MAG: mechanosensitive ion channel family protein [Acidobacteria bacterium]|nr:mechanosensitive ion channel family protein [Acidobacteriota bacterium]
MNDFVDHWLFDPTIGKFVAAVIGVLIVIAISRFVKHSLSRFVKDTEVRYRTRKFVTFLSYVLAAFVVANVYSTRLGGLTVAFGVAGAGIAFALQEVIASIAGWFAVSFAGFYTVGDRVQLGGIKGDVIDISILRTTLMEVGEWVKGDLYSGRIVRIANSFVFKEPVFNYSGDFPFLWDEVVLPIKYGSDRKLAREILQRAADQVVGEYAEKASHSWAKMTSLYLIENAIVEPTVTLVANDNWLEYTVRYVVDFKKRRTTKDSLFTCILDEMDQTEGKVSMASMTVHLVETPILDVRMKGAERV